MKDRHYWYTQIQYLTEAAVRSGEETMGIRNSTRRLAEQIEREILAAHDEPRCPDCGTTSVGRCPKCVVLEPSP